MRPAFHDHPPMPAHRPRRRFAPSLVVTLATTAAASMVPACGGEPQIYGPNPPQPTAVPTQHDPLTEAAASASATPTSDPVIPPPAVATATPTAKVGSSWTITRDGSQCSAAVDESCPPGDSCNPPRPRPYACPKDALFPAQLTQAVGAKTCVITYREFHTTTCPPHVMCNPPPPSEVTHDAPCPK